MRLDAVPPVSTQETGTHFYRAMLRRFLLKRKSSEVLQIEFGGR